MDLLESPLEALAFRYSATLAGPVWASLAILAAALGLWRIRVVVSNSESPRKSLDSIEEGDDGEAVTDVTHAPSKPAPVWCNVEGDGTPKGRFTAYFFAEDNREEDQEETNDVDTEVEEECWEFGEKKWEPGVMVVRRGGDLGWYRYQDPTSLNGSVVKLWDSEGGLTATSRQGLRRRI